MNEKQPFEKHLGEKLQQLAPPGDADRSWPQMKSLLDRDMPVGGGNGKRGGRWWMIGIVTLILVSGSWFAITRTGTKTPVAGNKSSEKNSNGHTAATVPRSTQKQQEKEEAPENSGTVKKPETRASSPDQPLAPRSAQNNPGTGNNTNTDHKVKGTDDKNLLVTNPVAEPKKDTYKKSAPTPTRRQPPAGTPTDFPVTSSGKQRALHTDDLPASPDFAAKNKEDVRGNKTRSGKIISRGNLAVEDNLAKVKPRGHNADEYAFTLAATTFTLIREDRNESPANHFLPPFKADYGPYRLPDTATKSVARRGYRYRRPTTPPDRHAQPRRVGTGEDKNFVVGLSLPLTFPLADQKATSYNVNAGFNTVSDYLPVPHFQYHFDEKSYIQSEIQFLSPQYIQPVLLFQNRHELQPGTTNFRYVTSSVYARKLYYFNFPVAVHYSPFRNFYLGTGLQFSSLLSGVALYEDRGYSSLNPSAPDSLFSQQYLKFRNDSVSNRLNGAEFRLLLDANYYWKRFTVGLRYNQALRNYVSLRVTSTSPYFEDKNKALQFYLRFNIWEDRKRKKSPVSAKP